MTLVRNGAARPRGRRVPPRAAKAALASLLVASGWLASCSSTTTQAPGLEVVVKTDRVTPGVDFDTLAVRVEQEEPGGTWGVRYQDSKPVGVLHLPLSLAVSRGASADQSIRITVSALAGASTVVARTAQLLMPSDRVAELLMVLSANCLKKTCSDPLKSCQPETGTCASSVIETSSLGTFSPADVTVDAGRGDAGVTDASAPEASASTDATLPPPEPGPETGAPPPLCSSEFRCDGQQPQSCAGGQWSNAGPPCSAQACSPLTGACQGICAPTTPRCAVTGNASETCGDDGQWGPDVPCVNQTCGASGSCQGVCAANDQRCDPAAGANAVQTCGADGAWAAGQPCAVGVCDPASKACKGPCRPGATQCSGNGIQTCGSDGALGTTVAPCTNSVCVQSAAAATCQGNCAPGTTPPCNGAVPQSCSMTGVLTTGPVTAKQCGADCAPGSTPLCNGTVPQSCSASGVLTTAPVTMGTCSAQCTPGATPGCNGTVPQSCSASGLLTTGPVTTRTCGAQCTPGSSPAQCSGTIPQTCSNSGQWQNGSVCAQFCTQGACTTCTASMNGVACGADLVCASRSCLSAEWAEWLMPNSFGLPNAESYADNGDGTVTDNLTGLMWQQVPSAATSTWAAAGSVCTSLGLSGHQDWRLPAIIELASIVDFSYGRPQINPTYFPNTASALFWSSSRVVGGAAASAWGVNFIDNGSSTAAADVSTTALVRCVR